ncbi:hypothetical protein [Staphylococcus auricularis]|uniref:hypothetical protein n=1 Tax=Staphylococcus auricularis TaxID=29379 RepID=UPI000DA387E0|nr:hypothetical protein [Staphylococcus auricularis]SQJ13741.1 hypothetical phage membrane protein [Staphylococcus auricularis]
MTKHKNILVPQKIATLSLLALGAFITIRGFYFAVNQEDVIHESEFYTTLYRVMPMWIWGALLIVFWIFDYTCKLLFWQTLNQ